MELKPTFLEAREWVEQLSSGNYQVASVMARDMERQMRGQAMPAMVLDGGDERVGMPNEGNVQAVVSNEREIQIAMANDHEMHATPPNGDETAQETSGMLEQEEGS